MLLEFACVVDPRCSPALPFGGEEGVGGVWLGSAGVVLCHLCGTAVYFARVVVGGGRGGWGVVSERGGSGR